MSDDHETVPRCVYDGACHVLALRAEELAGLRAEVERLETELHNTQLENTVLNSELNEANNRFHEMNTPTGREIELAVDLATAQRERDEAGSALTQCGTQIEKLSLDLAEARAAARTLCGQLRVLQTSSLSLRIDMVRRHPWLTSTEEGADNGAL